MIVTDEQILAEIQKIIGGHKVALFMKGLPEAPRCGFSARVVGRSTTAILDECSNVARLAAAS